jgi:hypothetical protein
VRLLLDIHIAKATVGALAKLAPRIQAEHLAQWRGGSFRNANDSEILAVCQEDHRVFVTFDQGSIPGLLRHWAAEGRNHSGVIFGDKKTVRPNSPVEVAAALKTLAVEIGDEDTANMVCFLRLEAEK